MKRKFASNEAPIMLFSVLVCAVFYAISPNFLSVDNIRLISNQIVEIGIISITMTMTVLLGGIDLSVGSLMALVAAVVGLLVSDGVSPPLACLLGILIGAVCGLFNGVLISRLKMPDIIVTLATMYIFRGIAVVVSGGSWVTNFPAGFSFYGQGNVFGIPFPVIVWIALLLAFAYVLRSTRFGRRIYAIGGNPDAARLAGMSIARTKLAVYLLSGMLAAIAGIIFASRVGSVQVSTLGVNVSFEVIAAVLLGGASIFGGVGTLLGTLFGVILLGAIKNGLILAKVSPFWIDAAVGFLIVAAILLHTLQRNREGKKRREILR